MKHLLWVFLTILPTYAHARWTVVSDFQLQLNEGLFDQVIADFRESLQGKQSLPIGSFTITPGGIPIQIQGVNAEIEYAFPTPTRIDGRTREWELTSQKLAAKLSVDRISATQTIVREIDGIIVEIKLEAECRNVRLKLPEGLSSVRARIKADLSDNQVKLTLPEYEGNWTPGAWQVESMQCSGIEGFGEIVRQRALEALSSFQNFDSEVREGIQEKFATWSKDASLLLLSALELPSGKDYLKVFYEPKEAKDAAGGVQLKGQIRFEYPFVAKGQEIEHRYELERTQNLTGQSPQLLLPFGTIRSLMMGEYFSGKLEYALKSKEIPAFTAFMQSRWQQFLAFPELQRYPKNAEFAFQFIPAGPPSFESEKASGANKISGDLNLPLNIRMFALIGGKFRPMVEFNTLLSGATNLRLLDDGKVELQIAAEKYPVTYGWSQKYVDKYQPSTRIAADKIGDQVRESLNAEGFALSIPTLKVGKTLQLAPKSWKLEGANMRLDFRVQK